MSAQLKMHLVVHGGGRTMIEKWLIGKPMFNLNFTVMREWDLQRITLFLNFKLFKIVENFKTTFWYYLSNFCVLISSQANVLFLYQSIEVSARKRENRPENHSDASLFLIKILKKFLYTWRMTNKLNWFYQPNVVKIGGAGDSVSNMEKAGLVFYTVLYSFDCKRVSVYLLYFSQ